MSRIKTSLDHKRIRRLVWLVLAVFVLLGYSLQSVAGSAYYSMVMEAYGTVSSPPVILEDGNVTGASTIYANSTSAKVSVAAPVWLSGWDQRVKITIDHNDVDSALSNFPVLVYLSSSSGRNNDDVTFVFDEVGSNSKKIAVTTSDGTQCYVEIEKWDSSSEQAWLWVKVPSVSNTSNTDLYLYYDNDHANNTAYVDDTNTGNSVNVWDSSFKMVQHMRDNTTSSIVDSTSNDNDGTKTAAGEPAVTTSGKISDAQDFDGSDDYIDTVSTSSEMGIDGSNTMTVSAWVNPDVNGDHQMFVIIQPSTGSGQTTDQVFFIADDNGELEIGQWGSGSYDHTFSGLSVDTVVWQHFVITYDGSTYRAYKNGSYEDSWTRAKNLNNAYVAFIGSSTAYAAHYFEGIIDEIRISNVSRTDAWIKASYESERDDLLDFGQGEDYVDNNTSNVDSSSPADKGTHSNFTAQQYGPDLINDTLTEENTGGGATDITPITAFQDTEQHITSSSLQSLNCETSALANGVTYLVIYCGNHGGGTTSERTEMVLEFGTTVIARGIGEGRGLDNHWDTGQTSGFYIVTGDGTNTLRFRGRNLAAFDDGYFGTMAIIAIPLTNLTENQDYWQSVQNGDAFVVTNAAVGSWTTLLSQTFNLPEAGNYLVLMSAEGQPGGSDSEAAMVRFRADGTTLGSDYHQEWESNDDIMSFMKTQVISLSSGNRVFAVECQSRSSATADFRRGRIVIIKASAFDQIVQTTDTTGDTTTSTTPVDFSGLDTVYTPNQQEYVVVLANVVMGCSTTDSCVGELYDGTSSYRVDSGEYENDNGFDSGRDQQPTLMAHTKQISSETTWKLRYRAVAGTGAIGKNPANTAGIQSNLIVWSLTISGAGNYELDLEVQWTNVDYDETNEELAIYVDEGTNTYSLDATGGYMIIGGNPDWGSTTGTISFWIKMDTSVQGRFWGQDGNMETRWSGTNLILDWGGDVSMTSAYSFSADTWYFVAIVWDENNDNLFLYIGDENNAPTLDANSLSGTWNSTTPTPTENRFLNGHGASEPVDGHGDDLRYWNIARSLTEIQSDYNTELTGSETNLRSYFKLNNNFDDVGPDDNDGSGSGGYSFSSDVPFLGWTPAENIRVDVWNGITWQNLFTNLTNGWNNVSVSSYLTSSNFTIRFNGGNETGDTTQDSWYIDATLLHVWTAQTTYDYVLKIVNQVASSWEVKLQVYDDSSISRLSNTTISIRNTTTTSNQIIISGGTITQSEGSLFDLSEGINETLYIKMSNVKASTSGTSYLYVHLKIQVPNSSTYSLYVITFEIT